jgi:hypothetical protein
MQGLANHAFSGTALCNMAVWGYKIVFILWDVVDGGPKKENYQASNI